MDFISEFLNAMTAAGFNPKGEIVADNKRHRAKCPTDKGSKLSAEYSLCIEGDFAFGYFRSWKDSGEVHKWHSKSNRVMDAGERRVLEKKIKEKRKAQEVEELKKHKRLSGLLTSAYKKMGKVVAHGYLDKKCIKPHGAIKLRKKGNELIIPLFGSDGQVWSVQRVFSNGKKFLFKGGKKQGAYFPICTRKEDLSLMLVCEGYATGASIREATGLPVIVAFDTGNLKPVLAALSKKYPATKFIICADNDAFTTKADGTPFNAGIHYAKQAAASGGGARVVWPTFQDDTSKPTDFNDLHALEGLEVLKNQIQSIIDIPAMQDEASGGEETSEVPYQHPAAGDLIPLPENDDYPETIPLPEEEERQEPDFDYKAYMLYDAKGNPQRASVKNTMLILEHDAMFKDVFRFNEFSHKTMVTSCPPWDNPKTFQVHAINDLDLTEAAAAIEYIGLTPDRTRVHNSIQVIASKNRFHPARDYFNALQWDGIERLDNWLTYYLGAEGDDEDYLAFIGKKWLTAAVTRIFKPACKFDHILVIEGEQGRGKSTALKVLSTFGDEGQEESYFSDAITIGDIQNKDTIQKIQGSIIVELAELAGFNKKDDEEIKRWITLEYDECRLPYERTTSRFDRQFVLSATTNSYDYLKDATGNRRYWPMCSSKIDLKALRNDKDQLWAEAVKCFKDGLYIAVTEEEVKLAQTAQRKRLSVDVWEDAVLDAFDKLRGFTSDAIKTSAIMVEMGMALREQDYRAQKRITTVLQQNGYVNTPKWINGKSVRGWVKKDD